MTRSLLAQDDMKVEMPRPSPAVDSNEDMR